jgi:hypothetical protein
MVQSSILGFPRMGVNRDLKKATEAYWSGKISMDDLLKEGKRLRLEHWKLQKDAGVDIIPSNDFAYYDHVLDRTVCRLFPNAMPTLALTLTMSTSPWAVATRKMVWTSPAWCVNFRNLDGSEING